MYGVREGDNQLQYWRQRAKRKCIALEDTNSKTFFKKARARKQKNEILMLKNNKGEWITDRKGIQDIILHFIRDIFQKD